MPTNNQSWDITDDPSLKTAVRSETQYDEGYISQEDMDELVDSAKRQLALQANVTSFYEDRGTAVALMGILCAKAKGAVENSPVRVKNLTGQDVTFRTSDGSSLQLGQYEQMTQDGLASADNTDAGVKGLQLTNTYFSNS